MVASNTPTLEDVRGVGKQIAKHLARLEIHSIQDLLFHLPSRYQDRTQIQAIRQVVIGDEAVIEGIIQSITYPPRGKTKLLIELKDGTAKIHLRFFHVMAFQADLLKQGARLRCYSEVRLGQMGLEMVHPEFKVIDASKPLPVDQHLTPIYPATEGLSQYTLRKLTANALTWLENKNFWQELIPDEMTQSLSFPTLKQALTFLHRPPRDASIESLLATKTIQQKRLIFEELLTHRIGLLHVKQDFQTQTAISLRENGHLAQAFLKQLPFQLTAAQARVMQEIRADLAKPHPMLRLVQGDVGSGKTVVAALTMLQAVENGYQAAMMAPTELLAEQHYRVFQAWLEPMGINVVFLSGNVKGRAKAAALKMIANGEAQIVLGTHALFQQGVEFHQLALMIIDEQHRFGVQQRALFREKGTQAECYPHQLAMTATPIPRTLAMSFYADLDCSTIDELPPGRTPVMTSVLAGSRREEVVARLRDVCKQGQQVYWVCTLIEESEVIPSQSSIETAEQLKKILPELRIGLIHGRLKASEKEAVMRAFQQGEIDLLVATTVIEVGVDVPNASVMVIENAERLGLSQLHQLRGRVGRGAAASHCILLYYFPLSAVGKERLAVMRETTDGFKIAQRDLELRGPGEVLGTRQTGDLLFRVADLMRDSDILPAIHKAADLMMREHQDLIDPLMQRWVRHFTPLRKPHLKS